MLSHKNLVRRLVRGGLIAALYAAVTLVVYPFSFGAVQLRVSEALCVLPFIFPEAVPGLFVGCVVANLLSPNIVVLDVVFGSLATLLAALLTSKCRVKWLAPLPPVICNALIVGLLITFSMGASEGSFLYALLFNMLTVGIGELVSCYVLGMPLLVLIERLKKRGGVPEAEATHEND